MNQREQLPGGIEMNKKKNELLQGRHEAACCIFRSE